MTGGRVGRWERRGFIAAVRRRVRLRTRLRRARELARRLLRRQLAAWSDAPAEPVEVCPRLGSASLADPRGRERYGRRLPAGRLTLREGGRWQIGRARDGVPVVAGRTGEPLDQRQRAVLAELGVVAVPEPHAEPLAELLPQLAATGVVLHAPGLPERFLAPELGALLRAPLPPAKADSLEWEIHSVRQRRAALRGYAPGLALPPPVSALLVTKRPRLLAGAVRALAAQTYPELELVVAVHGAEPPPDLRLPGPVLTVPPDRNLGEALAEATAAASGTLLTKVDDDDRYGPEHVWDVVLAWHYSGATITGKGSEFVYVEPRDRTVRRRMGAELFCEAVAGGTLTIARDDLAEAGGWPPVPRWVDRALLDNVLAGGGSIYRTHPVGFLYTRHGDGHTWQASLDQFLVDSQRTWDGLLSHEEFGTA